MKSNITLTVIVIATLALFAYNVALAADPTTAVGNAVVSVPWGNWVAGLIDYAIPIVMAAVAYGLRRMPSQIGHILMAMRVEQLLERAITYGANSVKGAVVGKALEHDVGSLVVAQAMNYAMDHGQKTLIDYMGGVDLLREKVIARIRVSEQSAIQ